MSDISGQPINPERLGRMKSAFERQGGVIDQGQDATGYLRVRGAEGLTFDAKTILLPEQPTTSAVFEEFIHTAQHRTGRFGEAIEQFGNAEAIRLMEMEAAEKLIRNRRPWGIPPQEVRQTIARLRGLRAEGK